MFQPGDQVKIYIPATGGSVKATLLWVGGGSFSTGPRKYQIVYRDGTYAFVERANITLIP